jgi:hypothetical protein
MKSDAIDIDSKDKNNCDDGLRGGSSPLIQNERQPSSSVIAFLNATKWL